jgi:hypothetical protein
MTAFHDEVISPELVLIDPELAARVRPTAVAGPRLRAYELDGLRNLTRPGPARDVPVVERALPEPPALARPPSAAQSTAPRVAQAPSVATARARRFIPTGQQARRAAAVLVVGGILGVAFLPPRQVPSLGAAASPPMVTRTTLAWKAAASGRYRVEILKGRKVVYRTATRSRHLRVPLRLGPGRYIWRVKVVVSKPGKPTRLRLIDHGWFLNRATAG